MFPGIDRGIVLLAGAGMRLRSVDGSINHALTVPLAPFHFPGDVPLMATLAGGACRDFNVMTRRGQWRSEVRVHNAAATLPEDDTADEGMLLLCCRQAWRVEAETLGVGQGLLWRGPRRRIVVRPVDDGAALLFARLCHDHAP
jgi:environmental stress-induced protein Ves